MRLSRMFKVMFKVGFIFLSFLQLQSCADVALSGAQVVYNRHTLKKNFNDQYITMHAFQALEIDRDEFNNAHISIATFNGEVLLAGQVPELWQKKAASEIVKKVTNVQKVYNLVQVASPSSTLTRMSDGWITTKVKAKLMASDDLEADHIKVLTENGTVYLMGTVPPEEADAAVEIARNTQGVSRVVKIFSYLYISKK